MKKKGGPEGQNVTKQESGIVQVLNCPIVAFATFALFASCFVISWFVALLNLRLLGYLLFFLVCTLVWQRISDPCEFCYICAYLEPPFLVYLEPKARLLSGTLTCAKFRRIKIEASRVDSRKRMNKLFATIYFIFFQSS